MNNRSKIIRPFITTVYLLYSVGAAYAQDSGLGSGGNGMLLTGPPEEYNVSPGGVDMRTGRYVEREVDLAIGDETISVTRLEDSYKQIHANPIGNMTHNWNISLQLKDGPRPSGMNVDLVYDVAWVNFGGRSRSFERLAPDMSYSRRAPLDNARLETSGGAVPNAVYYTFTSVDGVKVEFRPYLRGSGESDCQPAACFFASRIINPDGQTIALEYDTRTSGANRARLKRVVSSRGYAAKFEYTGPEWNLVTRACVMSLAETNETSTTNCPNQPSVSVDYTYTPFLGRYMLHEVRRSPNEIYKQTYNSVSGGNGSRFTISYWDPGANLPRLVNTIEPTRNVENQFDDVVLKQSFGNTETYDYSFYRSPIETHSGGGVRQIIAGGEYVNAAGGRAIVRYGFPEQPYSFVEKRPTSYNQVAWRFFIGPAGSLAAQRISVDPSTLIRSSQQETFQALETALALRSLDNCNECSGASGSYYRVAHQITPGPDYVEDENGNSTTFNYCDPDYVFPQFEPYQCALLGRYVERTGPEGDRHEYRYKFGNLYETKSYPKPGSQGSPLVSKSAYLCGGIVCGNKPTQTIDPNGMASNFEYSTVHSGLLKKTLPANENGVRPQTRFTYDTKYAWLKSGTGFSQAPTPIWLLESEEYCRTTASDASGNCAGGASDEVVTTYQYQQGSPTKGSNLLLLGVAVTADSQTLRTCYNYDAMGRKISETQPAANLMSCPS
jgi:hypothetical protein